MLLFTSHFVLKYSVISRGLGCNVFSLYNLCHCNLEIMATFTFQPTPEVPSNILGAPTTTAKVRVEPFDAYVDAVIRPVVGTSRWTATVSSLPRGSNVPRDQHQAVLCLTKNELGKYLGSINLGQI